MAWDNKIKIVRDEIREGGKDGRRNLGRLAKYLINYILRFEGSSQNSYRLLHRQMVVR